MSLEQKVVQAARWFVSCAGKAEESEHKRLQDAVVEYNHQHPYEPVHATDARSEAWLQEQKVDKMALVIFKNIADRLDDRGHFLEKFARLISSANEKQKQCLLPAAHRLIQEYDLEKSQKEKGILHEVSYM